MKQTPIHKKVFDFVIFSNLFIACCAVLMIRFTKELFGAPLSFAFVGFVFFSTLASYSVHWYLTDAATEVRDRRTTWLSANKRVHLVFLILSATGSIIFLMLEIENFVWILPAIFLTLMYSAPKIPLPLFQKLKPHIWGKTFLLAAMWAYITAAMPLLVEQMEWKPYYWFFLLNRFALIFAICILFDLRDRELDKTAGIKSIVTLLKTPQIKIVFTVSVLLSIICGLLLLNTLQSIWLIWILIAPAFLTYFLYTTAMNSLNDYLFYFILDGLMALSPLLYFFMEFLSHF